jgi:hypothetical protein
MRHPYKFSQALGVSYSITFMIDLSMGIIGYLMFGKYVLEEVCTPVSGLILDHSKYSENIGISSCSQLHRRLDNRNHSNYKNAP